MSNTWQVGGFSGLFSSLELHIFISFKIFLSECGALNRISDIIQWCLGDVCVCVCVCSPLNHSLSCRGYKHLLIVLILLSYFPLNLSFFHFLKNIYLLGWVGSLLRYSGAFVVASNCVTGAPELLD